ncbi:MAG: hypothetical protein ACOVQ3_10980, partial [Dolichospermum sp.]
MDLINYWYGNNVTQILTTVNLYIHTTNYNQVVSYYAPKCRGKPPVVAPNTPWLPQIPRGCP